MRSLSTAIAVSVAFLALLSTEAAALSTTKNAGQQKLTTRNAPTEPVTIVFARKTEKAAVGTLTLLVKSPVAGRLRLRFIMTKTGGFAETDRTRRSSPTGERPVVYEKDGRLRILQGQTRLLRIRFAIAPDAQPDIADGILVIRLTPAKPAKAAPAPIIIATKGQRGTSPAAGTVAPQPSTPSLIVTSVVPFGHWWLWGEHQRVFIPARVDEAVHRKYVVILGSDSGGLLRATLKPTGKEASSNGLTQTKVIVDQVGRSGKYTGDVVLGPQQPRSSQ
jgi:hypothetical protein